MNGSREPKIGMKWPIPLLPTGMTHTLCLFSCEVIITRVASHLARSDTPGITCIVALSRSDTPRRSDQWQGSARVSG